MDSKLKCVFEEGSADASPKVCLVSYACYMYSLLNVLSFIFILSTKLLVSKVLI